MKLASLLEKDMIKKMGFGAQGYHVGRSLKAAFNEFLPTEKGKGALDAYFMDIMNSSATPEEKSQAVETLNSIKEKAEDLKTLLGDFNFEDPDNYDISKTLFDKLSGDTDESEEDTLRFYDFNINASINSGMFENAIALLDQMDQFFDYLVGMIAASGTQKKQFEPGKEPKLGFQLSKDKVNENIDIYDFLKKHRFEIERDFGPRTFKQKQILLMMGDEAPVRSWLIKNGYMEEDKLPFEENVEERDLSDKEEKIAKDLPDKEFKKRYGKDWKSVKIATATKRAKLKEFIERTISEDRESNQILSQILSQLKDGEINFKLEDFLEKIIKKLENLDISIDYLSSSLTGTHVTDIGIDQMKQGRLSMPAAAKVDIKENKIREIIKNQIKNLNEAYVEDSLKFSHIDKEGRRVTTYKTISRKGKETNMLSYGPDAPEGYKWKDEGAKGTTLLQMKKVKKEEEKILLKMIYILV